MDLLNELKTIDAEEFIIAIANIIEENRRLRNKLNILDDIKNKETDNIMNEYIDFLELPSRIRNALCRNGILTISKLCSKTRSEIIQVNGLGENGLKKLVETMDMYDLHFAKEVIK